MKTLFCMLFTLGQILNSRGQAMLQQIPGTSHQSGVENLLNTYSRDHFQEKTFVFNPPAVFTFKALIAKTTSLKDLLKIQRKVARRLGVSLVYRHIEFDSSGLRSIEIEAVSRSKTYPVIKWIRPSTASDFGIFEFAYSHSRQWFIGSQSYWAEQIPAFVPH